MIIAIETIRSVARRAAEDPAPEKPGLPAQPHRRGRPSSQTQTVPPAPETPGLRLVVSAQPGQAKPETTPASIAGGLPRLARLLIQLFAAGTPAGNVIYIIAQALAAFLPLLDLHRASRDPQTAPEMTAKEEARIDLLRQERAARSDHRRLDKTLTARKLARPDRPPAALRATEASVAPPDDEVWNDLLDLTSEALETFIRLRDAIGVRSCLELLDLLAETFAADCPEAA